MVYPRICIIGAGNMGNSLIGGLIAHGHPADTLSVSDPSTEKLASLEKQFQVHVSTNNTQSAQAAEVILFAVKPQILQSVATEIGAALKHKPLILSIAAGIRVASIQKWLGGKFPIVRAMPNTPALIRAGATGLFANEYVTEKQKQEADRILQAVGITAWLAREELIDAVTALSGSGPAYFFHMMDALQLAAEELGLPKDIAKLFTLQTALGSARLAMESELPLATLKQNVTSPGGTTEKALSVLDEHHLHELYKKAVKAAKLHAETLATQYGDAH